MKALVRITLSFCLVFSAISFSQETSTQTAAPPKLNLDSLLNKVKQGHRRDIEENNQRIAAFDDDKNSQKSLLSETTANRKAAEQLSHQKEMQFEQNEQQITLLQQRLNERLGSLKELFGVLQLVASDTQGQFDASLTQIHYPERSKQLADFAVKMGQTTELPTIAEIEFLWYQLQREMTESGKVTTSNQTVLTAAGHEQNMQVTRIGTFNLVADGKYVQRISETGRIVEFSRQPSSRYMQGAAQIANAPANELIPFTIDPIRGQLIAIKGTAPDMSERVTQGGEIGYLIIALGAVVVLTAVFRLLYLIKIDRDIQQQLGDINKTTNNPLGRIINVYHQNKTDNVESIELKLGEAVLREIPKINWGLSFLKISAAIAPLMGLLGTVTGMIITFQAITLFGAGDPKLMAGGISQALVTTVLGLTVAIPTLLLHNLVQGKATKINEILEQESVALIAVHAEQNANT